MKYKDYIFDFERLDVYKKSLVLTNQVFTLTAKFDYQIQRSLGDQFRRAALSICNNIAEGSRKSGKSKKQFYEYSFDSARECIPMISLAVNQNLFSKSVESQLRNDCVEICNMLYALIASIRTD